MSDFAALLRDLDQAIQDLPARKRAYGDLIEQYMDNAARALVHVKVGPAPTRLVDGPCVLLALQTTLTDDLRLFDGPRQLYQLGTTLPLSEIVFTGCEFTGGLSATSSTPCDVFVTLKDTPMTAQSENESLRRQIAALERQVATVQRPQSDAERDQIAAAFTRADSVAQFYGQKASAAVPGETALAYRRRLLAPFLQYSPSWKETSVSRLDANMLDAIEELVYKDAVDARKDPRNHPPGALIPRVERVGGRDITTYTGDPRAWMGAFMTGCQTGSFVKPPAQ